MNSLYLILASGYLPRNSLPHCIVLFEPNDEDAMIEIFDIKEVGSRGTIETPKLDYHMRKQVEALNKAKKYYQNYPDFVSSNHILARLLYVLDYDMVNPTECFYRAVSDNEDIALNLGFGSSVHEPKRQSGFSLEDTMIVSTLETRNTLPTTVDWKTINPIKILYRQGTEGEYQLPTDDRNEVKGVQVIGIDIPLLAYMFAMFKKTRNPETEVVTTSEFVARYLLPNTLLSQFDCIIANVLWGNNNLHDSWDDSTAFSKVDHLSDIKEELSELKEETKGKTMLAVDFLKSIPTTQGSLLDTRFNYNGSSTTNTLWFETVCNLPVSLAVLESVNIDDDNAVMNRLARLDRRVQSARAWSKLPSKEVQELLKGQYDQAFFLL